MSFDHQYIEKYGNRALQAYKRSLQTNEGLSANPSLHTTAKNSCERPLKRSSSSCSRPVSGGRRERVSLKNGGKSRGKGQKQGVVNSLRLLIDPRKKKLVISDVSTPKETPIKAGSTKKSQKGLGTTNVNVYVNAINRSKSKESTPSRHPNKHCKHPSPSRLLAETMDLLTDCLPQKNIERSLGLLQRARKQLEREEKRKRQQERVMEKIRHLVGSVSPKEHTRSAGSKEYLRQLEDQVHSYVQKEQNLLKIIESLSKKGKGIQSSQEEDER